MQCFSWWQRCDQDRAVINLATNACYTSLAINYKESRRYRSANPSIAYVNHFRQRQWLRRWLMNEPWKHNITYRLIITIAHRTIFIFSSQLMAKWILTNFEPRFSRNLAYLPNLSTLTLKTHPIFGPPYIFAEFVKSGFRNYYTFNFRWYSLPVEFFNVYI